MWLPFGWASAARTLEARFKDISWAEYSVVRLYWYVFYLYAMQDILWCLPGDIYLQYVHLFSYSFDFKRPEDFINHVGPHTSAVKQECAYSCGEDFVLIFYDSVLVMRTHADNGRFSDNGFIDAVNGKNQKITFCGVAAYHQNGIL